MTMVKRLSFVILVMASACGRTNARSDDVLSVHLGCAPTATGVRCRLLALSRDVRKLALDVTALAAWQLSGAPGAQMSSDGTVEVRSGGDVDVLGSYDGQEDEIAVRLTPHQPGQVLAVVRGLICVRVLGGLQPVPHADVEVISGPNAGLRTVSLDDGSYELRHVSPAEIVIRATAMGRATGTGETQLGPGENRLGVVIEVFEPHRLRPAAAAGMRAG
jgi:hypothetical protein